MARKITFTTSLPKPVLDALEKAQHKLYRNALSPGERRTADTTFPDAKLSRALVIEMLIVDGLRRRGIKVKKE